MKREFRLQIIVCQAILLAGCSAANKESQLERLADYEGKYEYSNPASLILAASNFDTTLYAIIDDAQYPLKYISRDTFESPQKNPIVFQRDKNNEVNGYSTEGRAFKRLEKALERREWFPRKELYNNAEAYRYKKPIDKGDGLQVGDLKDAFNNPEEIFNMVKATINGEFRDGHSILIWKGGKLVLEEYFYGYTEDTPHQPLLALR